MDLTSAQQWNLICHADINLLIEFLYIKFYTISEIKKTKNSVLKGL